MPLLHRRLLFWDNPHHGGCDYGSGYGCPSPPSPPLPTPSSPSPPPRSSQPTHFPPILNLAPCPSPVHDAAGGSRDQGGTHGYGPAAADDQHRRFVIFILIAAAAVAFISLVLLGVSVAVRRRQLRRRRQALLSPAPATATNIVGGGDGDPEGGGGVVHHVWYIRTVGLDEAAIDSIAVTRYREGTGLLGAADCSVCLGEFHDGELVRLLPKCGHAFHVPCIDTWLRAHVNCPLCRSNVLDPAAAAAGGDSEFNSIPPADPDANDNAAADLVAAASDSTLEHEEEENDQEAPRVVQDQHERQLSSPEPLSQLHCPLPWNVRRAASMDAAIVSAAADVAALEQLPEAAPEGEQSGREKDRTVAKVSGFGLLGNLPAERPGTGGAAPRSFFSRHCRARSSVLPL